tara:strand:+ start:4415 stop:4693 length:279 start_codon:yes stop_codon:yes gene_type:complete
MPKDHRFTISGVRFLWRYTRLRGSASGWTYHGQKVLIDEKLKGRQRLETECHEWLHAANPQLSEEAVTQDAKDLSKILWALGYRITSNNNNK